MDEAVADENESLEQDPHDRRSFSQKLADVFSNERMNIIPEINDEVAADIIARASSIQPRLQPVYLTETEEHVADPSMSNSSYLEEEQHVVVSDPDASTYDLAEQESSFLSVAVNEQHGKNHASNNVGKNH